MSLLYNTAFVYYCLDENQVVKAVRTTACAILSLLERMINPPYRVASALVYSPTEEL